MHDLYLIGDVVVVGRAGVATITGFTDKDNVVYMKMRHGKAKGHENRISTVVIRYNLSAILAELVDL